MAESTVAVTEGSGKNLHTWARTPSGTVVQDQFMLPGEYPLPTFSVQTAVTSVATSSSHFLQIMAGSSNYVRIRRIWFSQIGLVTTAAELTIIVIRLTTAGSGGTAITPRRLNMGQSAATATAQTLPSATGSEGETQFWRTLWLTQTAPTAGGQIPSWEWVQRENEEPITIAAGTANGIALKVQTGRAGASAHAQVEFVETSWLGLT